MCGKGDYSLVITAPVEDVEPALGYGSTPGLRTGAVIWQGFSPGARTLAAVITLRRAAAAPALPLRIEIENGRIMQRASMPVLVPVQLHGFARFTGRFVRIAGAVGAGPRSFADYGKLRDLELTVKIPDPGNPSPGRDSTRRPPRDDC